jgi:hypothetical protein
MSKRKAGLQKEISAIFKGVPVQKDDIADRPSGTPAPQRSDYEQLPKQDKEKAHIEPPSSLKPPVPSQPTTPPPEPRQPVEPPKTTPPRPKVQATVKPQRQMHWQKTFEQIQNKLFKPKPGVSATRQKAMALSVPVLFIVLIFVFVQVFNTPSRKTAGAHEINPSNTAAGSKNEISWQIPQPYPATLRDPTQFGSTTTAQTSSGVLIVRGIVYSQDDPTAVIGTRIVREGEEILDATVVKINRDSVEFESDGKKWTQRVQH